MTSNDTPINELITSLHYIRLQQRKSILFNYMYNYCKEALYCLYFINISLLFLSLNYMVIKNCYPWYENILSCNFASHFPTLTNWQFKEVETLFSVLTPRVLGIRHPENGKMPFKRDVDNLEFNWFTTIGKPFYQHVNAKFNYQVYELWFLFKLYHE